MQEKVLTGFTKSTEHTKKIGFNQIEDFEKDRQG